jgi:hypothetical protein
MKKASPFLVLALLGVTLTANSAPLSAGKAISTPPPVQAKAEIGKNMSLIREAISRGDIATVLSFFAPEFWVENGAMGRISGEDFFEGIGSALATRQPTWEEDRISKVSLTGNEATVSVLAKFPDDTRLFPSRMTWRWTGKCWLLVRSVELSPLAPLGQKPVPLLPSPSVMLRL